jgi:hypothetical protein
MGLHQQESHPKEATEGEVCLPTVAMRTFLKWPVDKEGRRRGNKSCGRSLVRWLRGRGDFRNSDWSPGPRVHLGPTEASMPHPIPESMVLTKKKKKKNLNKRNPDHQRRAGLCKR